VACLNDGLAWNIEYMDLKARTFENVSYNAVARVATLIFQGISTIVLARILTAADYGVVGFAAIFISFLVQFSDLGIGSALIQKSEHDDSSIYTGFTVKFFLGITICIVAWLIAPLSAKFFDNPAIVDVIRILSLTFIINNFVFLPNVLLTRELNYNKISFCSILITLFQSTIAIVLALKGFSFWSIVIANVTSSVFSVFVINIIRPVKLKFMFHRTVAGQLIKYGGNIFLTGFIVFIIFNVDNFMIGSVAGSTKLGYYALAFNWGSMMCSLLYAIFLSVLFPTFSTMQDDRERIKNAYLRALEYQSFIGILANATLFVISKDFLVYVLGHNTDKWLPALFSFRVLCIYGIFRIILEPVSSVLMAIGRTDQLRNVNIVAAAIELVFIYPLLITFGIEGVAIVVTIAYLSQYIFYYNTLKHEMNIKLGELISAIKPAIISLGSIIIMLLYFTYHVESSIINMVYKIFICTLFYTCLYGYITKWKIFKEMYGMIRLRNMTS
jgi:PST family polysaccharide transporter